jgi:antitoxin component YwqK of YwqJK toxin-antitoxin module
MKRIDITGFNVTIGEILSGKKTDTYLRPISLSFDDTGKRHGICVYMFESVMISATFVHDSPIGPATFIYDAIKKREECEYVNGVLHGHMYVYSYDEIEKIYTFDHGVVTNIAIFSGNRKEEFGVDANGLRHGIFVITENDTILERITYKHGCLHGLCTIFDKNGNKKDHAFFYKDKIMDVDCESLTEKDMMYIEISGRAPAHCAKRINTTSSLAFSIRLLESAVFKIYGLT